MEFEIKPYVELGGYYGMKVGEFIMDYDLKYSKYIIRNKEDYKRIFASSPKEENDLFRCNIKRVEFVEGELLVHLEKGAFNILFPFSIDDIARSLERTQRILRRRNVQKSLRNKG